MTTRQSDGSTVQSRANGHSGPPMPLRGIPLTDNARTVLAKRYLRRGPDGGPAETEHEMFWRVASNIAGAETEMGGDSNRWARHFYDLLTEVRFFPNSPTFTGAGTPLGQLAACFVLAIDDDMGRSESGIFQTLRDAALIQQTGGGNGFSFSRLRPAGALVNSSMGRATGPVGFLRVYDQAFGEIAQGGSRRGANMAVLRVDHPDVESFIRCKTDESHITNFNISVGITDAFMQAVADDGEFELINPADGNAWSKIRARELFDMVATQAHFNGEPGVLFLDAANRTNPVPHLYDLEATNPCGEQWLGPFENCCLGSVNLAQHMTHDARVDWAALQKTVEEATRFLDDVVTANAYVPAVPQLKDAAHRVRRIGLGIMGIADMMYQLDVRYGSDEGQEFAAQVMEFVRYHTMRTSIKLAEERGPFPAIKGSLYDPEDLKWQPPVYFKPYERNWGRPALSWDAIVEGIKTYGIRNGAQNTVAPTGTISTVAGCEGYGCEPVFALAYVRHVNDNGHDLELQYTSPLFERAMRDAGLDDAAIKRVVDQVSAEGTCQHAADLPEAIRNVFVVSSDVTPEEHVRMQAAFQVFVDNSISKTINMPATATVEDVKSAYRLAWDLGCKGLTVYVTGSRQKVVLETKATKDAKEDETELVPESEAQEEKAALVLFNEEKQPRPRRLTGQTYRVSTPLGATYVTVNENGHGAGQPFEVFLHASKAGSDTAAVSEALGRLISYILRLSSPVSPRKRLREVVRQLLGIGGGRPTGFGQARVRSLPDGVAQMLQVYLEQTQESNDNQLSDASVNVQQEVLPMPKKANQMIGDLCPECGQASFINVEGCRKCYGCGYSEC